MGLSMWWVESCCQNLELMCSLCSGDFHRVDSLWVAFSYSTKSIVPVQLRADGCLGTILSQPLVSFSLKVKHQESLCDRQG